MTSGCQLLAQYVIHTVGSVWRGGHRDEAKLLADCYWNSMELAFEHGLNSIAFPCISTGVYRYPADEAAQIALDTVLKFQKEKDYVPETIFCCFSDEDKSRYVKLLNARGIE